jgi:hypothetical protein
MKHSNYFVKSDLSSPSPEMGGVLSSPERTGDFFINQRRLKPAATENLTI